MSQRKNCPLLDCSGVQEKKKTKKRKKTLLDYGRIEGEAMQVPVGFWNAD